jgi:hypothetical protein
MIGPVSSEIRFRVDPGDIPPEKAARRLHLTIERFKELLPRLLDRTQLTKSSVSRLHRRCALRQSSTSTTVVASQ